MSPSRDALIRGRNHSLFLAALVALAAAVAIWLSLQKNSLPFEALQPVSGRIESVERYRPSLMIHLDGVPTRFGYDGKGGAINQVLTGLCQHCLATLWAEPESHGTRFVDQIEVNGHMLRSYAQVKQSDADDNALAPYLFGMAALLAGYFLVTAWRLQERLQRQSP